MKRISLKHKGKKVTLDVLELGFFGKIFGFMFTPRENAKALLFQFEKPTRIMMHSFFVFLTFAAIWLDKRGKTIQIKKVTPFTTIVRCKKPFCKLIEIPINAKYREKLKALDFPRR